MFKKGDKYIHFTKYGGVNKGEVVEVFSNFMIVDAPNRVRYHKYFIKNTKGNIICINEENVCLVDREYSDKEVENMLKNFKLIKKK